LGTDNTHWRYGALGRTRSTRWAAVSAIRRAVHDGQMPRRLHENVRHEAKERPMTQ
jgi:hypothetical protein